MDYLAAFKDIVAIMNIDYAGFADKCINADSYITELSKRIWCKQFKRWPSTQQMR